MASISHLQLISLLLLSLFNVTLPSSSWSSDRDIEYNKWVSWNIENYRRKAALKGAESIVETTSAVGRNVLDVKLRLAEINKVIVSVCQNGTGDFMTIREALNTIPLNNTRRVILMIKPGIYREKIVIPRALPFVTFLGNASDPPTVTGNDTASTASRDGRPLGTYHSATVAVNANYFVAVNMKFENTASHDIGSIGGQGVALRISGTKAAFYNCSFYGAQDTLYDHKGMHYFKNCYVQGSVDFIFGYGRSLYENCYLNSTAEKVASLTAQKRTNASLSSGFSFKDGVVTGSGHIYLGRAWGDYSRVIFSFTFLDKIVLPQGWSDWGDQNRDYKVYYGEYKCSGPGANFTGRVPWARMLGDEEAKPFIGTHYVEGDSWLIGQY
ncbi:probable pectinesterase 53 isoform X1 [Corylus avellana]|uniref:probable pectinesterase 53 isoform X1 n=1 Tax=Corylus avellana TaxID=13451 RepID=UPI00286A2E23|nr:probable pectinesterase 53 isoform X1 [Corylus avellana]